MVCIKRIWAGVSLALAAVLLGGCSVHVAVPLGGIVVGGAQVEDTRTETFPAGGLQSVRVDIHNGPIEVEAWDRAEVEVTLTRQVQAASEEKAQELLSEVDVRWEQKGDALVGRLVLPDRNRTWVHHRTRLVIRAPRALALDLTTRNGYISARGVTGKLDLMTHNGPVTVEGGGSDQPVRLDSFNGRLELSGYAGGGRLNTHNGAVQIAVPETARVQFELHTMNGRIAAGGTEVHGPGADLRFGGAGPLFEADTKNGSITVLNR